MHFFFFLQKEVGVEGREFDGRGFCVFSLVLLLVSSFSFLNSSQKEGFHAQRSKEAALEKGTCSFHVRLFHANFYLDQKGGTKDGSRSSLGRPRRFKQGRQGCIDEWHSEVEAQGHGQGQEEGEIPTSCRLFFKVAAAYARRSSRGIRT